MSLAPRLHLTLLALSLSLGASAVACSRPSEAVTSAHSAATEQDSTFDANDVLDDVSMTDTRMTVGEVQAFLERTPYGKRSALAAYKPTKTRTAAQLIVEAAVRFQINPMLLLVRAQLESELISKSAAPEEVLARAFGCGCAASTSTSSAGSPSGVCSPTTQWRGFESQATCAASQLRSSLDRLTGKNKTARPTTDGTAKGWAANERHTTRDGIEVIPDNDATAVLYAYKPWVGKLGNGDPDVGGMSAHARLWTDFTATTTKASDAGTDAKVDATTTPTAGCGAECSGGSVCDESTGRCVECAPSDTSNCQADGLGAACIAGRCGCEVTSDCGAGRTCDRLHGICIGTGTPGAGTPPTPDPDAGQTTKPPAAVTPADEPPLSDPTTSPTPDLPPSDAPSSSASKRAPDDKIDVPSSPNGGCTLAPVPMRSTSAAGGAWALGVALVLSRELRRRRRSGTSATPACERDCDPRAFGQP